MNTEYLVLASILLLAGGVIIIYGLHARRRAMLVSATPVVPAAMVVPGLTAVAGVVEAYKSTREAPYTGKKSVWCSYRSEESYERMDRNGKWERHWRTTDSGSWHFPFFVRDESGRILVDPTNVDVDMSAARKTRLEDAPGISIGIGSMRTGSNGWRRTETALAAGDPVYVIGPAGTNPYEGELPKDVAVSPLIIRREGASPFLMSDRSAADIAASSSRGGSIALFIGGSCVFFSLVAAAAAFFA